MPVLNPIEPVAPMPSQEEQMRIDKENAILAKHAKEVRAAQKLARIHDVKMGIHSIPPSDKEPEHATDAALPTSQGSRDDLLSRIPIAEDEKMDPWGADGDDPLAVPKWALEHETWWEIWQTDIIGNDIDMVPVHQMQVNAFNNEMESRRANE